LTWLLLCANIQSMTIKVLLLKEKAQYVYEHVEEDMDLTVDIDFTISKPVGQPKMVFTFINDDVATEFKLRYG